MNPTALPTAPTVDRLFVSDLDQTLLQDDASLSEFTQHKLNTLLSQGLPFTVATGRSFQALQPVVEGLKIELPVISLNGAFISDLQTGEHLHTQAIESNALEALLEKLGPRHFFMLSTNGRSDHLYYAPPEHAGQAWYAHDRRHDPRLCETPDPRQHLDEDVVGITLIEREEKLRALEEELAPLASQLNWVIFENQYQAGWFWMTLHDRGASKAQGIQRLMEFYDLCPSRLTVYGDHRNDISMFKYAGDAVAVRNAVPELKVLATRTIGCNQSDSVAHDLSHLWDSLLTEQLGRVG